LCFFKFCSCVLCAFCCANFRVFSTKPRECLGRTSPNLPILCREGRQTSTQSINRYATHMHMICVMVRCIGVPSVYHKSVLYRNGSMDRPGFRHRGYSRLILHCVLSEYGISKNKSTSLWNVDPNSELIDFFFFFLHGTSTVPSLSHTERRSLFTTLWP